MKYNDEDVKRSIENGESYDSIGRRYGVSGTAIKKYALKIGMELKPRRKKNDSETFNKGVVIKGIKNCPNCGKEIPKSSPNKFCSSECFQEYRFKTNVEKWKNNPGEYTAQDIPSFIRTYMIEKVGCKCEKCGWSEVNPTTGAVPLEIHHIDGDCTNNFEDNLQLLCPNCHSLTENFGSLNNGKSKRYKRYGNRD